MRGCGCLDLHPTATIPSDENQISLHWRRRRENRNEVKRGRLKENLCVQNPHKKTTAATHVKHSDRSSKKVEKSSKRLNNISNLTNMLSGLHVCMYFTNLLALNQNGQEK